MPLALKPSECGITVRSPSASRTITPVKRHKNAAAILSNNVFVEKTTLVAHLGIKSGFLYESLRFDDSIIMILSLIENTFGFSLGLKDVSFYVDSAPGFSLDLIVRLRVDAAGIILNGIKTILRR